MKKSRIILLTIISSIALTACGSSNGSETTRAVAETTRTTETQNESPEAIPEDVPTEPEISQNPQVGEAAVTDIFEFTVTNAYVVDDLGPDKHIPEGAVYVAVEYELKNISKKPVSSWDLPSVHLVDGNDAIYNQDSDASWYFEKYTDSKMISDMNPGIKTRDARIFEVSIDTLNSGGMRAYLNADKEVLVDLNLYYAPFGYGLPDAAVQGDMPSDDTYYGDNGYDSAEGSSHTGDDTFPSGYPGPNMPYYSDEGDIDSAYVMIPQSSTEYISDTDIYWMTPDQLRRAKNEIYARHGRRFKDSQLQSWFDEQSWYQGSIAPEDFSESVLSEIEKANIKVIQHRMEVNSQ